MNYNTDMILSALKMIIALVIVLGGLAVVLFFVKRILQKNALSSKGRLIRVLGSAYIGVKKSIMLVDVQGAILVLGVTNDKISLLTKLENDNISQLGN